MDSRKMTAITEALNSYRDAVAERAYWQANSTYGDGRLGIAQELERLARTQVINLFSED